MAEPSVSVDHIQDEELSKSNVSTNGEHRNMLISILCEDLRITNEQLLSLITTRKNKISTLLDLKNQLLSIQTEKNKLKLNIDDTQYEITKTTKELEKAKKDKNENDDLREELKKARIQFEQLKKSKTKSREQIHEIKETLNTRIIEYNTTNEAIQKNIKELQDKIDELKVTKETYEKQLAELESIRNIESDIKLIDVTLASITESYTKLLSEFIEEKEKLTSLS